MDDTIRTALAAEAEALTPTASLVAALADVEFIHADEDAGLAIVVEELRLSLPVELDVGVTSQGRLQLATGLPVQIATSIMPVVHQLTLRVTREEGDAEQSSVEPGVVR